MAHLYGGDEVNAIVIDIGTNTVKAGYAGDDVPKAVFSSYAGVTTAGTANGSDAGTEGPPPAAAADAASQAAASRKLHVGAAATYRRDDMEIVTPFQGGLYADMDIIEELWRHALQERLRVNPLEHPMLLAEPAFNTRQVREKTVELMFERFDAPALFLAKDAVLSSFASGRQTSLVVDAGHAYTTVAAVHDGYVLNKSVLKSALAGQLLNSCLLATLEAKGTTVRPRHLFRRREQAPGVFDLELLPVGRTHPTFTALAVDAIVADVKESVCRVADSSFVEADNANIPTISYELPDGTMIQVGPERFKVPEVVFQPAVLSTFPGVTVPAEDASTALPQMVMDSVGRCDVDVRRELFGGVLLVGGSSLVTGFKERLERDLLDIVPQTAKVKLLAPPNPVERRFSVWVGGSILASLGTFQQMWMSRQEYQEQGASLIHRRAP